MPVFAAFGNAVYTRLVYGRYLLTRQCDNALEACEIARELCDWVKRERIEDLELQEE